MTEPDRVTRLFLQFIAEGRPRCPVCRYDLRGASAPKCSECGEQLELFLHHSRRATRRTSAVVLVGLPVLTIVAAMFLFQLTEPRAIRSGQVAVLGIALGVTLVLTFAGVLWLRPRPPRRTVESSARRAGRLSLVRALARDASLYCPVRRQMAAIGDDWCPICFERVSPAIRPVHPRSLRDDRSELLRLGIVVQCVYLACAAAGLTATALGARAFSAPLVISLLVGALVLSSALVSALVLWRRWIIALPSSRRVRLLMAAQVLGVAPMFAVMVLWSMGAR